MGMDAAGLPPVVVVDLLMSGMTIALNLLVAAQLIALRRSEPVVVMGILFCGSTPLKILMDSPLAASAFGASAAWLAPIAQLHTIFFWWFALALFDDRFRLRGIHLAPVGLLAAAWLAVLSETGLLSADAFALGARIGTVALMLHILAVAIRNIDGDLVDERRKYRVALAVTLPLAMLSITATEIYGSFRFIPPGYHLIHAGTMLAISALFIFWITGLKERILLPERDEQTEQAEVLSPADRLELGKLRRLVDAGVLLEPALAIGALADRLGMPEHRLRRIINRGLGYRNFAAFVNDHRVEEAKRRLADPDLAREQIIQHAYALGYVSLAPFNRAFRERVGVSPSEFRSEALSRVEAA